MMYYLFTLMVVEIMTLMWLHHRALAKNLQSLQRYLARRDLREGAIWVEGDEYSFYLCQRCIDKVISAGRG